MYICKKLLKNLWYNGFNAKLQTTFLCFDDCHGGDNLPCCGKREEYLKMQILLANCF